ncbi:MAG: hypothetical protein NDI88_06295 [Lysobacter sp.]|nr:hypothetical protein [Lysobacter sp.]
MPSASAATPSVGAGARHTLALGADGRVRTWGDDSAGVLGIGRALSSGQPAAVAGASGITAIAAGDSHVLALKGDRTVIAWGNNANGQVGDGTTTQRSTPVPVTGLANVVQVAAGGGASLARTADGRAWEWGRSTVPTRVEGLDDVVEISAGSRFMLARLGDGTVWAWGSNDRGQLGDGTRGEPYAWYPTPRRVSGLANVTRISAGGDHALALRADGSVWAWGANGRGETGDGTGTDRLVPAPVDGLAGIASISAGYGHSTAIRGDGAAFAWGANGYAELGDGTYIDRPSPVRIAALDGAVAISTGFLHAFALTPAGTFLAWGTNDRGQLGHASLTHPLTPVPVPGLSGFRAVSVGDLFTVALKEDGTVWTWGDNAFGQLGNSAFTFRTTASAVALEGVARIASGGFHAVALKADGSVVAWGDSRAGQIGDGESVNRSAPVTVRGLGPGSSVRDVAAGGIHTLALEAAGTVLSWGDNYSSQLGPRESGDTSVPARITGLADVAAISAGGAHSVALKTDGTVWTWGHNHRGQLGDGTRSALYQGRLAPAAVAGMAGVKSVSAGGSHTVALKSDGTLWAWGANSSGQLGDGTFEDRLAPVRVARDLAGVVAISAGDSHTLALTGDGAVWAWGANWNYRLGDATSTDRAVPVQAAGVSGVVAISASSHSVALRRDGSVWAWGGNETGQLGDGTLVDRESAGIALREGGAGSIAGNDWFLDLDPAAAGAIPADKVPVFLLVASPSAADITASVRFRPEDVGETGNVYVFAVAPASIVKGGRDPKAMRIGVAKGPAAKADAPVACVLAQLSQAGQMVAVTADQLQAYLTGVLSAQGASVSILNGVPAVTVAGSTFFVGYGSSGSSMIDAGINRGAVTVPGSLACQPGPPQKGWWWNPLEDGRGFSLEVRGNNIFFAAFLYDVSGRSTWYVSTGPVSLEGSYYSGDLLSASGGQTLGGAYPGFPALANVGRVSIAFHNASTGTIVWPGGTVPIQRFSIVPNGLGLAPVEGQPESGWWWNEQEAGRGFFMEWQGGNLDIAGYMYDDAGNSVWYLTTGPIGGPATARSFSGSWWSFGGGQTLTGPWKPNRQLSNNVAPVTIQFSGPDTALMTLPGGRTTLLRRHRF